MRDPGLAAPVQVFSNEGPCAAARCPHVAFASGACLLLCRPGRTFLWSLVAFPVFLLFSGALPHASGGFPGPVLLGVCQASGRCLLMVLGGSAMISSNVASPLPPVPLWGRRRSRTDVLMDATCLLFLSILMLSLHICYLVFWFVFFHLSSPFLPIFSWIYTSQLLSSPHLLTPISNSPLILFLLHFFPSWFQSRVSWHAC